MSIGAPVAGTVLFTGRLDKIRNTTDDITVELTRHSKSRPKEMVFQRTIAWNVTGAFVLSHEISVEPGDRFELLARIDSPIDLDALRIGATPEIAYRSATRDGKPLTVVNDRRTSRTTSSMPRTTSPSSTNGRAEIEPAIAELKNGWGIGKIPSDLFCANHALFLLKLLAHNLMRRFVRWAAPRLVDWRVPWLRRVLINIPRPPHSLGTMLVSANAASLACSSRMTLAERQAVRRPGVG